ncbi:MAG: NH(3)-dependent synthetase, partial [Frankiales bacterium]|nr:NH(3)-dependent synthetase [Frankiales bacterium]
MAQLRIGLAQVDSTVGDLPGNADVVSAWTARAREQGCHLVAFPEMMLTGYPPEDLVLRSAFVEASLGALAALATRLAGEGAGEVAVVVGYCGRSEQPKDTPPAL